MGRTTEYRVIMAVIVGWCALGFAGSVWPVMDRIIGSFLIIGAAVAPAVVVGREVWAEIELRRECSRPLPVEREELKS